jgi:hypothetical protein
MHKFIKWAAIIGVGYTVVASVYNSSNSSSPLPNPIGNLLGFA